MAAGMRVTDEANAHLASAHPSGSNGWLVGPIPNATAPRQATPATQRARRLRRSSRMSSASATPSGSPTRAATTAPATGVVDDNTQIGSNAAGALAASASGPMNLASKASGAVALRHPVNRMMAAADQTATMRRPLPSWTAAPTRHQDTMPATSRPTAAANHTMSPRERRMARR